MRAAGHETEFPEGVFLTPMRPKKTILCVDDNEQTLSVRKFLLETRGYRVYTAINGQEAITLFSSTQIDLVLTDLSMPQMDGNALIGHLKEISPEIPMILTSDTVRAGERAHRADAFLAKGCCTPAELVERIRVMSARKRGPRKAVQPAPGRPMSDILTAQVS
jgi:two-component system response regulator CpxR